LNSARNLSEKSTGPSGEMRIAEFGVAIDSRIIEPSEVVMYHCSRCHLVSEDEAQAARLLYESDPSTALRE
jgi:hypothetical protein